MAQVTCPRCSRVGNLSSSRRPGTMVRCPGCGERFLIPDQVLDVDESDVAPAPLDALGADLSTFAPAGPAPPVGPLRPVPPEPWFYGGLVNVAAVVWGLGLFVVGLGVLIVVLLVVLGLFSGGVVDPGAAGVVFTYLVATALGLVPVMTLSMLLSLAVDAARNLRAIRYR